ncbi:MAG TPA: PDZ domain-containing protein [Burkholderiales bacterium]|nr:PDZ domain-containing protein [Burkholderiales bacterium]
MTTQALAAALAVLAACAQAPPGQDSVIPGTISVIVRQAGDKVVVAAVGKESPEVRVDDVVLRYNGEAVTSARQFYRLVVDSAPGSRARLELLREGTPRVVEVLVRELDLVPRV